jgi:hypothetical protein
MEKSTKPKCGHTCDVCVPPCCDRCRKPIKDFRPPAHGLTAGYYHVTNDTKLGRPGERYVCDRCMWRSEAYTAIYGIHPKIRAEQAAVGEALIRLIESLPHFVPDLSITITRSDNGDVCVNQFRGAAGCLLKSSVPEFMHFDKLLNRAFE